MYIPPNSTVKILKGVRLNEGYSDTAYFETKIDQETYFNSKVAYTLNNQSYTRKTVGQLKVQLTIAQLFGTSYMMFKNSSFENKWFYAFITNYEYVNNETSIIYFEIDLLQTYMFDYTLKPCMVERQHAIDDSFGVNRIPEGLDTGEYVYNEQNDSHLLWHDWSICIFHTLNNDGRAVSTIDGQMMGGLYSGLNMKKCTSVADANAFLTNVSACALEGAVVAVVMLPTIYVTPDQHGNYLDEYIFNNDYQNPDLVLPTSFEGYTPHNNKCLLAPFRGIYVTNGQGTVASYNIEDFHEPDEGDQTVSSWNLPKFKIRFSLGAVSDCMLQPLRYRGEARQYGVELTGFPQCAYTTDGFKSWMARNEGYLSLSQTNLEQQNYYQNQSLAMQQQGLNLGNEYNRKSYNITKKDISNRQNIALDQLGNSQMFGMAQAIGSVFGARDIMGAGGALLNSGQNLANLDIKNQTINWDAKNAMNQANLNNSYNNNIYNLQTAELANQKASINASNAIAIKQLLMQKHVASLTPPSFHGQSVGSANKLFGYFGYHIGTFKSRRQFIERADAYFDLYGYAQNNMFTPYRKARKHYTYVKTRGANFKDNSDPMISTGVPADDMAAINNLFDGGIRFWVDPNKIGNYDELVPNTNKTYREDNSTLDPVDRRN